MTSFNLVLYIWNPHYMCEDKFNFSLDIKCPNLSTLAEILNLALHMQCKSCVRDKNETYGILHNFLMSNT